VLACAELALGLFVFSADSPALANSAAERLLAEANIPAPANALRMNPRLLLMCAPSKTRNARRDLRQRLYRYVIQTSEAVSLASFMKQIEFPILGHQRLCIQFTFNLSKRMLCAKRREPFR
jgi:tRNA U38,U39,U40 pseudouridine synthase TruA